MVCHWGRKGNFFPHYSGSKTKFSTRILAPSRQFFHSVCGSQIQFLHTLRPPKQSFPHESMGLVCGRSCGTDRVACGKRCGNTLAVCGKSCANTWCAEKVVEKLGRCTKKFVEQLRRLAETSCGKTPVVCGKGWAEPDDSKLTFCQCHKTTVNGTLFPQLFPHTRPPVVCGKNCGKARPVLRKKLRTNSAGFAEKSCGKTRPVLRKKMWNNPAGFAEKVVKNSAGFTEKKLDNLAGLAENCGNKATACGRGKWQLSMWKVAAGGVKKTSSATQRPWIFRGTL